MTECQYNSGMKTIEEFDMALANLIGDAMDAEIPPLVLTAHLDMTKWVLQAAIFRDGQAEYDNLSKETMQ